MTTMFKPDSFQPIPVPPLPHRPSAPAGLTEEELEQMAIAPSFNASTQPGHTTLRVAVRDIATGMVPVLYINTLTHSHRNRLDHYVLDRYSTTSSNRDSNWFVGSFDIPEGITDIVGIIPLPADSFDDGAQPGADRKAYKALRENVRPVWTSVEVMKFGNSELNALVNAGQLQRRPTQQSINQQRFYKDELKGILDSAIDAWLYLPCEHSVDSVLLVSDGRAYIDGAKLLPHVNSANTAVVLFAPKAEDDRQVLLGNLEKLETALKEHILPWAKEQAQHSNYEWPERSEAFTIAGGSLGGYAAAAIVLHHPEIALNAIVQSASLWWPDRHFRLLEDWVNRLQAPDGYERVVFHEYGEYDIHLAKENEELARYLDKSADVVSTSRSYRGGHDYLNWRKGILDGHAWILEARSRM